MSNESKHGVLEGIFIKTVKIGIFLLPFLPLVVVSSAFFPFITWKNFLFRIIVAIVGALWAALAVLDRKYRPRSSFLFWALLSLIFVAVLSTIFSVDPFRSFWSNFERMEGLVTYLHLFLFFLAASSVMKKEKDWSVLLFISLGVSVIVSFYGFLEKAQIIGGLTEGGRIFSTLGNSIYLAVYLLFHLFFIAWAFLRSKALWLRIALGAAFVINSFAFVFAESRGALVGLGAGILTAVFIGIFTADSKRWKYIFAGAFILAILTPLVLFQFQDVLVSKNIPGISRLAAISLDAPTSISRFNIWKIAWEGIKDRPILGWGLENFQIPYAQHYIPDLFGNEPWFDRTHNVVLDWFVHAGILGGAAYIVLFVSVLYAVWKLSFSGHLKKKEAALATGLTVAYLVQNLFVFDNLTSHILFFSFISFLVSKNRFLTAPPESPREENGAKTIVIPAAFLVLGLILAVFVNARPIMQAHSLISSMAVAGRGENFNAAMTGFRKTLAYDVFGKREVREQLTNLANTVTSTRTTLGGEEILDLLNLTISELEDETAKHFSPKHEMFLARMKKQFFSLTGQRYDEASEQFEEAINLAPSYLQTRFGLIELYLADGRTEEVRAELSELEAFEPRSTAFWNTVATAYLFIGDGESAVGAIDKAGELGVITPPNDLENLGRNARARGLDSSAVIFFERARDFLPSSFSVLSLAELYAERGDFELAIKTALEAEELDPSLSGEVGKFIESINEIRGL